MQDGFLDLQRRHCPPGVPILYPVDFDSSKDLGRALIESYSRYSLEEGESLCNVPGEGGALNWFVYQSGRGSAAGEPSIAGPSVETAAAPGAFQEMQEEGGGWIDTIKIGVAIAFLSFLTLSIMRSIMEAGAGSSMAPGRRGEGGAAPAAPERVTPVPGEAAASIDMIGRPWERTEWWGRLNNSERVNVTMIIEQDVKSAMKSSHFRKMYVRGGVLSEEGIKYLIDSREGNLYGRNDMRLGRVPLRAERTSGRAGLKRSEARARRPVGRLAGK